MRNANVIGTNNKKRSILVNVAIIIKQLNLIILIFLFCINRNISANIISVIDIDIFSVAINLLQGKVIGDNDKIVPIAKNRNLDLTIVFTVLKKYIIAKDVTSALKIFKKKKELLESSITKASIIG